MFHGSNPIIGLNEFRTIVSEASSNFWVTLYSVYIVCNVHCIIGRQPLSDPSGAYTGFNIGKRPGIHAWFCSRGGFLKFTGGSRLPLVVPPRKILVWSLFQGRGGGLAPLLPNTPLALSICLPCIRFFDFWYVDLLCSRKCWWYYTLFLSNCLVGGIIPCFYLIV